jgi:hypothetical protein
VPKYRVTLYYVVEAEVIVDVPGDNPRYLDIETAAIAAYDQSYDTNKTLDDIEYKKVED